MEDNKETNLNKVFGNNIKMLRQYKMALSQKETARRLGISLRTYTRFLCCETEEGLPTSKSRHGKERKKQRKNSVGFRCPFPR